MKTKNETNKAQNTVQALLATLAPHEIITVNADVPEVVEQVLSVRGVMRELRPQIEQLSDTKIERYDALEAIAWALSDANTAYTVAPDVEDGLPEMLQRGVAMRSTLGANFVPLVAHGMLTAAQVSACSQEQGYRGVGTDLRGQVCLLRGLWKTIEGRTLLDAKQIDAAHALGTQLIEGAAARGMREEARKEQGVARQKLFSLLVREYNEVRRAVAYLRWNEGDADELVPSLYAKGGGTRYKKKDESEGAKDGEAK